MAAWDEDSSNSISLAEFGEIWRTTVGEDAEVTLFVLFLSPACVSAQDLPYYAWLWGGSVTAFLVLVICNILLIFGSSTDRKWVYVTDILHSLLRYKKMLNVQQN